MRTFFSIIGMLIILSSCGGDNIVPVNSLRHDVAPESLIAYMKLRLIEDYGSKRVVAIVIQNPELIPLQSVRAWLRFDPNHVSISDLIINDERFSLFAPGERTVDSVDGFIKIGAASKLPVSDSEFTLASFTIHGSDDEISPITFYDWRPAGDGHTAILSLQQGKAVNILSIPPSIEL